MDDQYLGGDIVLDKKSAMLQIDEETVPLKAFYTVGYIVDGSLDIKRQAGSPDGKFSIIHLASYNTYLVLDDSYLNSTFIQMFVFEQYDKSLFEKVVITPDAKVYRVRI